jgi:hypothetical protein
MLFALAIRAWHDLPDQVLILTSEQKREEIE